MTSPQSHRPGRRRCGHARSRHQTARTHDLRGQAGHRRPGSADRTDPVGLLARGHILLEGVPGVAKTLAVETFARVIGGSFSRVQFTPDLVPTDLIGTRIYRQGQEKFDTELGPVVANFLLADEINRAPAKVQSALLEVMAERHVSIGGTTYPMPDPFLVMATQNPIENEGVYPLPEAQRDRFLFKVLVGYPSVEEEREIVHRMGNPCPRCRRFSTRTRWSGCRRSRAMCSSTTRSSTTSSASSTPPGGLPRSDSPTLPAGSRTVRHRAPHSASSPLHARSPSSVAATT